MILKFITTILNINIFKVKLHIFKIIFFTGQANYIEFVFKIIQSFIIVKKAYKIALNCNH